MIAIIGVMADLLLPVVQAAREAARATYLQPGISVFLDDKPAVIEPDAVAYQ